MIPLDSHFPTELQTGDAYNVQPRLPKYFILKILKIREIYIKIWTVKFSWKDRPFWWHQAGPFRGQDKTGAE